jgi:hypothetical protein
VHLRYQSVDSTPSLVTMNQAEDVVVILSHDHHYKFHAATLARSSTRLAELLTQANAVKLGNRARGAGVTIRWMIELKELPSQAHPGGVLELVVSIALLPEAPHAIPTPFQPQLTYSYLQKLTHMGERADGRSGLILNQNGRIPTKAFEYYETIFYAFYGKEMRICDTDMGTALRDCIEMVDIARYLGCINFISKPVEVALMKHGQALYRSIQSLPLGWSEMARQIKSETIFRECIIHLAGNWKKLRSEPSVIDGLKEAPAVRRLVDKYHRRLLAQGKALEQRIVSTYPGDMLSPRQETPIKREIYSKDILIWMALNFFRHWIASTLIGEKGYQGKDCGYQLYKQLGAAGEAYMDKNTMIQFHERTKMTKKAMNVLENHLLEIKECVKQIVERSGILATKCQLDVHRYPVMYLTCTQFERGDFPWEREERVMRAVTGKRGRRLGGNEIAQLNLDAVRRSQGRGEAGESLEVEEDEKMVDPEEYDAEYDAEVESDGPVKRGRYE